MSLVAVDLPNSEVDFRLIVGPERSSTFALLPCTATADMPI